MPIIVLMFIGGILAEIWTLLTFARTVGIGATLLWLLTAAVLGVVLIRLHGLATARRVQEMMARGEFPGPAMLDGLAVVIAGILLTVPGLLSDAVAAILLVRPLRNLMLAWAARRWAARHPSARPTDRPPPPGVIEGESRRVNDNRPGHDDPR